MKFLTCLSQATSLVAFLLESSFCLSETMMQSENPATKSGWTSWIASFSYSQEPQLQTHHDRDEEQKQSDTSFGDEQQQLSRSTSYALNRTGTINPDIPKLTDEDALIDPFESDEEEGLEIVSSPQSFSDVWIQPTFSRPSRNKKSVSFSSINIHIITSIASNSRSSKNKPQHITHSIDHYESTKPKDDNPIPYHLRYHQRAAPSMPNKEDLRSGSSLMDKSQKKRWQRLPRLFLPSINSNKELHPKFATSIDMAGTLNEWRHSSKF
jgi:hypothetical protein